MATKKIGSFEPGTIPGFRIAPSEERYEIIKELIDEGMDRAQALNEYKWAFKKDDEFEKYLKKLKEL